MDWSRPPRSRPPRIDVTTNRRRYFRQPVALPVRVRVVNGGAWPAVTLDLSARGTRLLAPEGLLAGGKVQLTLGEGEGEGVRLRATVLGARPVADRFEIRMVFEALVPEVEELLHREVHAAQRRELRARSEWRDVCLTPADPVTPAPATDGERRRSRRVRIDESVRIHVGTAYVGARIVDISSGGAKIRLAQVMRVDERMALPIPGSDAEIRAVVRSVRVRARDLHFEIGVRFEFGDQYEARALREYVATLRRAAEARATA
ncbi:PilZ domain-containing protein [bacterium]|nr:MAG: PilZ domain-containing protein [bacterium]